MGRLLDRYRRWRGEKLLRQGSLLVGLSLSMFSLVVLPGQWVPVLFRDDLTVICTSLMIFAVGAFIATASMSRRGVGGGRRALRTSMLIALGLIAFAIALYKIVFGGIGWPGALDLTAGILFVLGCVGAGTIVGTLSSSWFRPLATVLTSLGALLLAASGAWLFTVSLPDRLNPTYTSAKQMCETRKEIRYCANPGYEPFIDDWQLVVEKVFAAAPVEIDRSAAVVAQLLDDDGRRAVAASIAPGLDWGRGSGKRVAELALGLEAANWVTGIESREIRFDPKEPTETCAGGNGARAVVAYWLAGRVSSDAAAAIAGLGCCADAISGTTFGAPAIGGGWDTATEMLEKPPEEVARELADNWERITTPDAPISLVGEVFDLSAPPSPGAPLEAGFSLCESRAAMAVESGALSRSPAPEFTEEDLESDYVTLDRDQVRQRYRQGITLFTYDPAVPLGLRHAQPPADDGEGVRRHEISYTSPLGGRVPATVLDPVRSGALPAVIFLHGMPGSGLDTLELAETYAEAGILTLSIDAPFARRTGEPVTFTARDRHEQIQLIVDLRRAVDLLGRYDVDPRRIGFYGGSYGASMGGLLAGVEPRISLFVLEVGDGGLVEHFTGPDDSGGPLASMNEAQKRRWIRMMEPIEPLYYVGFAAPSELLFLNGLNDEAVTRADSLRFQSLASEPKEIRWYESGHALPPAARCYAMNWLLERLGATGDCEA